MGLPRASGACANVFARPPECAVFTGGSSPTRSHSMLAAERTPYARSEKYTGIQHEECYARLDCVQHIGVFALKL